LPVAAPLPPPGGHALGAHGGALAGAPSPLLPRPAQRLRTSHIGHAGSSVGFYAGGHYQQSARTNAAARQCEIIVQECFINQENEASSEALKDFTNIQYEMLIQANDPQALNWIVVRSLKGILDFHE